MHRADLLAGFGTLALCAGPAASQQLTFRCEFVDYCAMDRTCDRYGLRGEYHVDLTEERAHVLGALGQAPLVVIPTVDGVTFVEVTRSGNVMTTTIAKDGAAVHSRNAIIGGALSPSQYYGTCETGGS